MLYNYLTRAASCVCLLFSLTIGLGAQPIMVTSTTDSGAGSLRDAVAMASSGDTIFFDVSTDGTPILLQTEISLEADVLIRGNGAGVTMISGDDKTRIFNIPNATTTLLRAMTLMNGAAAISGGAVQNVGGNLICSGVAFMNNTASGDAASEGGGAIHNAGSLRTISCTFSGNVADGASGSGGAIINTAGNFQALRSTFSSNTANRAGGAIEDLSGSGTSAVVSCTMTDNVAGPGDAAAPGNGGAIHITGASSLNVNGGSYSNNFAASEGGALWNGAGQMRVSGAQIVNNEASGDESSMGGGGIYNLSGQLIVRANTNIAENVASGTAGSGGGILNDDGGTLQVLDATINANVANRAGGGIEDASGSSSSFNILRTQIDNNVVNTSPGNGGGIHIGGDGSLTIREGSLSGNTAGAEGGGVWNNNGKLTIIGTTIAGNIASGAAANQGGGAIYGNEGTGSIEILSGTIISGNMATGTSGSGGGILVDIGHALKVVGATITGNTANRAGGGIEDASGSASVTTITSTDINDNEVFTSPGNGGGIHIGGDGSMTIQRGSISNNVAGAEGGGVWNANGVLDIQYTTIDGNSAAGSAANQGGGGLYNNEGGGSIIVRAGTTISNNAATGELGSGGGILNDDGGTLSVTGATITANTANRAGGGIEDASGSATVVQIRATTISDNIVSTFPGNGGGVHVGGDGSLTIRLGSVTGNSAGSEGGGLWNNTGTMEIVSVLIDGNEALGADADTGGGGIYNNGGTMIIRGNTIVSNNMASGASGSGGGLLTTDGTVTVLNTDFIGNTASRAGGAVEQLVGDYISTDVNYMDNVTGAAPGNGGAFHITAASGPATSSFTGGEMSGNTASNQGGALWNNTNGTMTVNNVSMMNNSVTGTATTSGGGGFYNNGGTTTIMNSTIALNTVAGANGGGILNSPGSTLTVMNSTVSTNTSGGSGGGIFNVATMDLVSSTVALNSATISGGGYAQSDAAASLNTTGSIFATNVAVVGGVDVFASAGVITSGGYNLVQVDDQNDFPADATDLELAIANLGPLADNGGSTMTHALMCPSPAVNAGDPAANSPDQRGRSVFAGRRDIGAYELRMNCPGFTGGGETEFGRAAAVTEVSAYPNPASGSTLMLNIPARMGDNVRVEVLDANGRVRSQASTYNNGAYEMSTVNLQSGTYTVRVLGNGEMTTTRVVMLK